MKTLVIRSLASTKRRIAKRLKALLWWIKAHIDQLLPGPRGNRVWHFDGRSIRAHVVSTSTPEQVRLSNLKLAELAAAEAAVVAFCVPANIASRGSILGVRDQDWDAFVEKLVQQDNIGNALVVWPKADKSARGDSRGLNDRLKTLDRLWLYVPTTYAGSSLSLGQELAVEVQRWTSKADGMLVGPCPNPVSQIVSGQDELVSARHQNPDSRTFKTLAPLLPDEIDFDVDIVYTWVDDSDSAWRARRNAALEAETGQVVKDGASDSRFKNRDELRYSLRSINMYAPWARKIWIVTDDQVPSWLNEEFSNVSVVSHQEIWGSTPGLPTFNSHAIESRLHHIEGLAEHYVYFNDDVFLAQLADRGRFFTASGLIRASFAGPFLSEWPVQEWEVSTTVAGKNIRAALQPIFGKAVIHRLDHTPHPLTKSVMSEVEQRFPEAFEHLASSQFRDREDLAPIALAMHYAYMSGLAVESDLELEIRTTAERQFGRELARLNIYQDECEALCINDVEVKPERRVRTEEQNDQLIASFLSQRFPLPAPWEK